jgi:hypothetical protein
MNLLNFLFLLYYILIPLKKKFEKNRKNRGNIDILPKYTCIHKNNDNRSERRLDTYTTKPEKTPKNCYILKPDYRRTDNICL